MNHAVGFSQSVTNILLIGLLLAPAILISNIERQATWNWRYQVNFDHLRMFLFQLLLCIALLVGTHGETGAAQSFDEVCLLQFNLRTNEAKRSMEQESVARSNAGSRFYPDSETISPLPKEAYRSSCTYLTGAQCEYSASHCWYHSGQCISLCHWVDYRFDLTRSGQCDSSPHCHVRGSQCEENCDKL